MRQNGFTVVLLRVSSVVVVLLLFAIHVPSSEAIKKTPRSGAETFDLLRSVIFDKELSQPESLKYKSKSNTNKPHPRIQTPSKPTQKSSKKSPTTTTFRTELLRQELSRESQENCLAKLLCGDAKLPSGFASSNASENGVLKDYGLLVKEFLDIFSDDDNPTSKPPPLPKKSQQKNKPKDEENDDDYDDSDEQDKSRTGEKFVNITTSLTDTDDNEFITTSSTSTVTSVTTGATITEIYPAASFTTLPTTTTNNPISDPKTTLEEVVGEKNPRKSRALQYALSFGKGRKGRYIKRKIRELRLTPSPTHKLMIATKIATRLREPRQCREFQHVASEILSTCPLTAEVVRYFNSNLKNGTQIALLKNSSSTNSAGLVVLNDRGGVPHSYFLDHSPIIANTLINTDLKNPSVGDRFPYDNSVRHPIYENAYPQKFNTAIVNLSGVSKKRKNSKQKEKRESDEDEESGEADDENDEEEEDSGEDVRKLRTQKPRKTIKLEPQPQQKQQQQLRQLPQKKGVIKVYGVYQPSFDSEFSKTSTQIGTGPTILFDHDDDGVDVRYNEKQTPQRKPKPTAPPPAPAAKKKKVVSVKDESNSDEEQDDEDIDEEEEDEEEDDDDKKRSIVIKQSQKVHSNSYRRPHTNFATTPQTYGSSSFPAPLLRSRPRTPFKMVYKPRRTEIRRVNIVHAHHAALMRPPVFKQQHRGRFQQQRF